MIPIDLNDFIQNVQQYQGSPYAMDTLYSDTLKRRDVWDGLAQINEQKTKDIVLYFLNAWKCRISYVCAPNLAKGLQDSAKFLANFRNLRLQDVSLKFLIDDNNIQEAFRTIATVQAGRRTIGATATSKILHMINPNFFVMADENTRFAYGCCENELGYVNFMWRMKLLGDILIDSYSNARTVPKEKVFQKLVSECQSNATTLRN